MEDLFKFAGVILILTGVPILGYAAFVAVRAMEKRVEGRLNEGAEVDDLKARIHELEQLAGRVEELEERVDFSERVLIQEKQATQLPGRER